MAAKNKNEQQKLALLQQIDESRQAVIGATILLNEQVSAKKSIVTNILRAPKKIKTTFSKAPFKTLGIALSSSLGASLLFRRKKHDPVKPAKKEKKSFFSGILIAVLKPILQRLLIQLSQQWLNKRVQR